MGVKHHRQSKGETEHDKLPQSQTVRLGLYPCHCQDVIYWLWSGTLCFRAFSVTHTCCGLLLEVSECPRHMLIRGDFFLLRFFFNHMNRSLPAVFLFYYLFIIYYINKTNSADRPQTFFSHVWNIINWANSESKCLTVNSVVNWFQENVSENNFLFVNYL